MSKHIVLGVTGSIAAFKAADLTSKLKQKGYRVTVIMTESALKLVGEQTFFTLSREPVISSLWGTPTWQPEHVSLAQSSDILVIAPCTANMLAKLAHGIADDTLSTYAVTHRKKTVVFPAMNPSMWSNVATQDNVAILRKRKIDVVTPSSGHVACGDDGEGRFPEVPLVLDYIEAKLCIDKVVNENKKVLVTAGPTREAVDPVRFLTNKSTGKMGFAIATAASSRGLDVTLISGPVNIPTPLGVKRVDVMTAKEMKDAVLKHFPECDVYISAAAVADYRPAVIQDRKIKKSDNMSLPLERTDDILMLVKDIKKENQIVCGFAAETNDVEENAKSKIERKKLDFIVSNDVSNKEIGFGSNENEVNIYDKDCNLVVHIDKQSKISIGSRIIETVVPT